MKKHVFLLSAVVLALPLCAAAQSSVTLFGVIDAGYASLRSQGAGHNSGLVSGGSSTSRLGFRGTEQLGGGMSASFWLEGQLNNDTGGGATQTTGLDFSRRSTVSLSGGFGEVRLGRDIVPTAYAHLMYDPTGNRGMIAIDLSAATLGGVAMPSGAPLRNSNTVNYFLPATLGGAYGQVQYAFGEKDSATTAVGGRRNGNYLGARGGYKSGPLDISAAYGEYAQLVRAGAAGDYRIANIGASYDFGFIKPMGLFQRETMDSTGSAAKFAFHTFALGLSAPVGKGSVLLTLAKYDNKTAGSDNSYTKLGLGYVHSLSKRTALYAQGAVLNNKGTGTMALNGMSSSVAVPGTGRTPGGRSTGYAIGIKHSF